jgi:hypothetical protein
MDFDDATIEVDELIDETFELAILSILLELEDDFMRPERRMRFPNAQQGQQYVEELLNSNHPDHVRAVIRMSKETFYSLRDWLLVHAYLKSSKHISIEQKLLIFLHITSRPASNRDTMERFSHSNSTVSKLVINF